MSEICKFLARFCFFRLNFHIAGVFDKRAIIKKKRRHESAAQGLFVSVHKVGAKAVGRSFPP